MSDVSDNRRPGSSSLGPRATLLGRGRGLSLPPSPGALNPAASVAGMAGGGEGPHIRALHERKESPILDVCADTLTTPKLNARSTFRVRLKASTLRLSRVVRAAPGARAPPRLPARGTHAGHRAALHSVSALPRGDGRPDRFRPQNGQPMRVAHGQGQRHGQRRRETCPSASAKRRAKPSLVLFCLWSAVPERGDTTTHNRGAGPGRTRDPMPPLNVVPVCLRGYPVIYGR